MWEFKLYARGGMGAVTAAKILIDAAIIENKFGQAIPSYGQERKGAPVYAFARVDTQEIQVKSYVYRPNCIVVFDMSLPKLGIDIYKGLKPGAIMVSNARNARFENGCLSKIISIDAEEITDRIIGNVPPNAAMLGALCRATGCVSIHSMEKAILAKILGKAGELNAEACRTAYEEAVIHEAP